MKRITYLFMAICLLCACSNIQGAQKQPLKKVTPTAKTTLKSPFIGTFKTCWGFEGELFFTFTTETGAEVGLYAATPISYEGGFHFYDGIESNPALIGKKFRISYEESTRIAASGKTESVYKLTRVLGIYEGILKGATATSLDKVSLLFDDPKAPTLFINQDRFPEEQQILLILPEGVNYDYADKKLTFIYEANDDNEFFVRDFRVAQ